MNKLCVTLIMISLFSIGLEAEEIFSSNGLGNEAVYYSCPPSACFSCDPCGRHFYVGLDGGWAIGLGYADRVKNVGGGNTTTAYNAYARSGYHVGGNLGCRWNCLLRTDLSYTYLKPHSYKWRADTPSGPLGIRFDSRLHSHLILFNTYLHLNGLSCFFPCLDPYITGGIGVAINHLDRIREIVPASVANIQSSTQTHFGARLGIGAMKRFSRCWVVDGGFNANYIGRVASDNRRTNANGTLDIIGPYHFENNWVGTFYLGVKRIF